MTVNPIGCLKFMKTKRGEKKAATFVIEKERLSQKIHPKLTI